MRRFKMFWEWVMSSIFRRSDLIKEEDMNWENITKFLALADDLAARAADIYAHLHTQTGETVEQIRARRDALSAETKAILKEERENIQTPLPE